MSKRKREFLVYYLTPLVLGTFTSIGLFAYGLKISGGHLAPFSIVVAVVSIPLWAFCWGVFFALLIPLGMGLYYVLKWIGEKSNRVSEWIEEGMTEKESHREMQKYYERRQQ